MGSPPERVPDWPWLETRRGIQGLVLGHKGTGEFIALPDGAELRRHPNGFGVIDMLTEEDGAPVQRFACAMLTKALMRTGPAGDGRYLVHDTVAGTTKWQSKIFEQESSRKLRELQCAGESVSAEVFVSTLPREGLFVRWELVRPLSACMGDGFDGHYMWRHVGFWSKFCASLGFAGAHIRAPSAAKNANKVLLPGNDAAPQDFDPAYTASTVGFIACLVHWATSMRSQHQGHEAHSDRSECMLQSLLALVCPAECVLIDFRPRDPDVGVLTIELGPSRVCMRSGSKAWRAFVKAFGAETDIAALVIMLSLCARRPSKVSYAHLASEVLVFLANMFSAEFDLKRNSQLFSDHGHEAVDLLFKAGSNRPRRISGDHKLAVSAAVSSEPSLRTPQQFLAARRALMVAKLRGNGKVRANGLKCLKPKAGGQFPKHNMLQYLATAARDLGDVRHVSLVLDATRVSNRDLMVIGLYSQENGVGCWCPPQVMRDSRLRVKAPGTSLTPGEKKDWKASQASFMQKRALATDDMPSAQVKRVKSADHTQRLASYDWLLAVQNSLNGAVHFGLERFKRSNPHRNFDEDLAEGEVDQERILTLTMDQEQKQWCAAFYLQRKANINIELFNGPFHRRWNDITNSLCSCGLYNICLLSLFINNVSYGPWQKGGFYNELTEVGEELMCHLDPDDELLLRLWPAICMDNAWDSEKDCNRAARKAWIERLPTLRPFAIKGLKASPSRWFTISRAIETNRTTYHTKLLGLTLLAIKKGWVQHWDEMFCDRKDITDCRAASTSASSSSASGAAAASSSSTSHAKAPSAAAAKAVARQSVSSARARAANALHAVAKLMAKPDLYEFQQLVRIITKPLQREHSNTATLLKSERGVMEYYALQSAGHWHGALAEIISVLNDLQALREFGLVVDVSQSMAKRMQPGCPEAVAQDSLASTCWHAVCSLLSHRSASMLAHSFLYPFVLGGINSDEDWIVTSTLATFKEHWQAYAAARKQPLPLPNQLALRCTLNTRTMESTARIIRQSDYKPSPQVKARCEVLFKGWGQERIVEDALKHIRESETRDANNGVMRLWKAFEIPRTVNLMSQYERPEIRMANLFDLPTDDKRDAIFRPNTIAAEAEPLLCLKGIMDKQDWSTFNATGMKALPSEMQLLVECHKRSDWTLATDAWWAAVLPTRQVVLERQGQEQVPYLVLMTTPHAALLWPMQNLSGAHMCLERLSLPLWKTVFDLDRWRVVPSCAISPLQAYLKGVPVQSLGILLSCSQPQDVLQFQAERGFQGVPESIMTKVAAHLDLTAAPPPGTDLDAESFLAMTLIQHFMPQVDQAAVTDIMLRRLQEDTRLCDADLTEFATDDMISDVVLTGDQKKIKSFVTEVNSAAKLRAELKPKVVGHISKHFPKKVKQATPSAAEGGSQAKQMTAKAQERWWAEIKGDSNFIEQWKPPIGSVSIDNPNGRYFVMYPGMKRRSISWTVRGVDAANLEALKVLWSWHEQATSDRCTVPAVRRLLDAE